MRKKQPRYKNNLEKPKSARFQELKKLWKNTTFGNFLALGAKEKSKARIKPSGNLINDIVIFLRNPTGYPENSLIRYFFYRFIVKPKAVKIIKIIETEIKAKSADELLRLGNEKAKKLVLFNIFQHYKHYEISDHWEWEKHYNFDDEEFIEVFVTFSITAFELVRRQQLAIVNRMGFNLNPFLALHFYMSSVKDPKRDEINSILHKALGINYDNKMYKALVSDKLEDNSDVERILKFKELQYIDIADREKVREIYYSEIKALCDDKFSNLSKDEKLSKVLEEDQDFDYLPNKVKQKSLKELTN